MNDQKIFYQKWTNAKEHEDNDEDGGPGPVPAETVIVLAAGGTGGHVMPAISVGRVLEQRGFQVFYVTDQRCGHYFENAHVKNDAVFEMPFAGLGDKSLKNILPIVGKMTKGLLSSKKFFKKIRPHIVVGFGGYSTFPPLMMASLLKIPFVLYEPDSHLGVVNRFFAKSAKIIGTGFQEVKVMPKKTHTRWVGMPVRAEFKHLRGQEPPAQEKFTVMVVGGSQGAGLFSTVLPEAVALLPSDAQQKLHIIQQVRKELAVQTQKMYEPTQISVVLQPFFTHIWNHLHQADIVISRAGASTVAEITMLKKAALLVPYKRALNDHQKENALSLVKKEAAWMLEEHDFTPKKVAEFLQKIMADAPQRQKVAAQAGKLAKENAAESMAQTIVEVLSDHVN